MKKVVGFLKYVNRAPFPFTVKRYTSAAKDIKLQALGGSMQGWEAMFTQNPSYRVPETREEWLQDLTRKKDGQDSGIQLRARDVAKILRDQNIKTVFSVGAGTGVFEYHLKHEAPEIRIIISDFVPEVVRRLHRVFVEGEVWFFDALDIDSWRDVAALPNCLVLMYRIDREFSNIDWRIILRYMRVAKVRRVLIVVSQTVTLLGYFFDKFRNAKYRISGTKLVLAGYLRSSVSFERLWKGLYFSKRVQIGSWMSFLLWSERNAYTSTTSEEVSN